MLAVQSANDCGSLQFTVILREELAGAIGSGFWNAWPFGLVAASTFWRPGTPFLRVALWSGFFLALVVWLALLAAVFISNHTESEGGANIGLGLMVLAAPLLAAAVLVIAFLVGLSRAR